MNPLLTLSATKLAAMIRAGEATSSEVVEAHIARIGAVNPAIRAVVADRFAEARREAEAADEKVRAGGDLPPLHGVPCSIKECFAFTGMPHTAGLVARKGVMASSDATTVARLRAAGAIPLGVTNLSELCMWMESSNRVYGRSNNPYDPSRIVGGSSGGEGAVVGAGGTPFGLGSDIGGSIRLPAFFNGVFGHKPSGGLVPGSGQFPVAHGAALRYLTTGPLCRRAEDLWPLLKILAGPDGLDSGCREMPLGDPGAVDLASLRVVTIETNGVTPVDRELTRAQRRVADRLAELGAKVETATVRGLRRSRDIWSAMLSAAGGPTFTELLANGGKYNGLAELAKLAVRRSDHTIPAIVLGLLEKLPKMMPKTLARAIDAGGDLREEMTRLVGERGVLLYPSYSRPAPRHDAPLLRPFDYVYTAILNVLEFPSTQVPLGLSTRGLPLGVQVAAVTGNDHLTVAVALDLEKTFGGWVPPPRLAA
jgi:fatty acid amide hydrolase 2